MMKSAYLRCKYHPEGEVYDNFSEGDIVCKECALILTERNFGDDTVSKPTEQRTSHYGFKNIIKMVEEQDILFYRDNDHLSIMALFIASHLNGKPKTREAIQKYSSITKQ